MSVIDYDRETKTATILITSLGSHHKGDATLIINGFTTDRQFAESISEDNINAYNILNSHTAKIIDRKEMWIPSGGRRSPAGNPVFENSDILKADEIDIRFDNIGWTHISNIGFVDCLLHIQTVMLAGRENQLLSISFVNSGNEVVYIGGFADLNETSISGYENLSTLKFGGNIVEIEKVINIIINGVVMSVNPTS